VVSVTDPYVRRIHHQYIYIDIEIYIYIYIYISRFISVKTERFYVKLSLGSNIFFPLSPGLFFCIGVDMTCLKASVML
jgi:hypothetical protein